MRKNLVGMATLVVALSAIATLTVSYAGQGTRGAAPEVPDHPLIKGPIKAADLGSFQDASSLWLADALAANGAQAKGKKTKFNETTILHTSVFLSAFSESLVRHKEWVPASGRPMAVGGDPKNVRPLTGQEWAALSYVINRKLTADLKTDLQADENGIRGAVSSQQLRMSDRELQSAVQQSNTGIATWLRSR